MRISAGKSSLNESELKFILTELKTKKLHWHEVDQSSVLHSMLLHIGSTDSELRDGLIYASFYRLIMERKQIEATLLSKLLQTCMEELLFKGIGEKGTDSVFTRSFTTLLIALILGRDNQDDFLSRDTIEDMKEKLIKYMELEEDIRGFVPGKGWAHSVAHAADMIDELVKNPKLDKECYPDIVRVLWSKVLISNSVYIHGEDERLLIPILEMLDRGVDAAEFDELFLQLPIELKFQKEQIEEEKYWILVFNIKTFLKSFYIKINGKAKLLPLQQKIEEVLVEIS